MTNTATRCLTCGQPLEASCDEHIAADHYWLHHESRERKFIRARCQHTHPFVPAPSTTTIGDRVHGPLELAAIEYAEHVHGEHPLERSCLDEAFMRGGLWAGWNEEAAVARSQSAPSTTDAAEASRRLQVVMERAGIVTQIRMPLINDLVAALVARERERYEANWHDWKNLIDKSNATALAAVLRIEALEAVVKAVHAQHDRDHWADNNSGGLTLWPWDTCTDVVCTAARLATLDKQVQP